MLLVVGGTGFLGRHICRIGVKQGLKVVSLSRKGAPESLGEASWLSHVDWRAGNALDLNDLKSIVSEASAVIHTVGSLLDDSIPYPIRQLYQTMKGNTGDAAGTYEGFFFFSRFYRFLFLVKNPASNLSFLLHS